MVFAIVLQWGKTMFWGLRHVAFSKSSLLAIVQAIVRIVRDCTKKMIAEKRFDGLFICSFAGRDFFVRSMVFAIVEQWEKSVSLG